MINASTQNQSASLINFRLSVVAGILGCLIAALFAVLLPTADTYADTNKCRTMIYRSDTAGYDSPYVQVCADVNDNGEITGNISLSENKRSFLGVAVEKYNGGNGIAENIRVCQRTGLDGCESGSIKFYYAGNGPSSDNVYTGLTNFNDFTDKVLYNVSNIAGYEKSETVDEVLSDGAVTQETITYRYNGIYDGSYADWQNAGSPDQNGNTDNDENTEETTKETEDSSGTSESDPCYDNSSSVGWLVCPVITWFGTALEGLYDDTVVPFLQIESNLVDTDPNGTYGAWGAFRDIANIVFVILVIIVILSQVTGLGISNYGIKKALPKIIVIAILVNLSYVLCQLAVDVSNIIGFSAESFLSSLASNIGSTNSLYGATNEGASYAFAGIVAAVAAGAAFATGGPALVITTVISLFSALISLLFMFIVLGIRKAGIVLLIALAPLAIVCYALPNTEKLAKRWLGMFKALLFVYPIAGILIGGCNLAAQIILKAVSGNTIQDAFLEIIGMLLFVVPFFMLPSLLKKSIAGADQIFGSIVNKGEGLTGKARSGIQNSGVAKRNRAIYEQNKANSRFLHPIKSARNSLATDRAMRSSQRRAFENAGVNAEAQEISTATQALLNQGESDANLDSWQKSYEEAVQKGNFIEARTYMSALANSKGGRKRLMGSHQGVLEGNSNGQKMVSDYMTRDANIRDKAPQLLVSSANKEFVNDDGVAKKSVDDLAKMDPAALKYLAENHSDAYQDVMRDALSDENRSKFTPEQLEYVKQIAGNTAPASSDRASSSDGRLEIATSSNQVQQEINNRRGGGNRA